MGKLVNCEKSVKLGSYQSAIILNHFEGLNLSLPALKISDLEQLNNEIFALLSTRFYCLKIDHLIKRIGIIRRFV